MGWDDLGFFFLKTNGMTWVDSWDGRTDGRRLDSFFFLTIDDDSIRPTPNPTFVNVRGRAPLASMEMVHPAAV